MNQNNSSEFYEANTAEFIEKFIYINKKPMKLNNNQKNLIKILINSYVLIKNDQIYKRRSKTYLDNFRYSF